jgi:hypothetical protein
MERARQILAATLVAYVIFPLFMPLQEKSMHDVKSWGLKGPGKGLPIPVMGVYAFSGLNPAVTLDMSYAYDFDKEKSTFWIDFDPDSLTVAGSASSADFEAFPQFKSTTAVPARLPGWYIVKQFALLRYRVQFKFESKNVATIRSCIAGCWSPLSWAYNKALGETLERRRGGVWARENYVSLANRTRLSGYELLPVLLPGGKVNRRGLNFAKAKLAAVGATLKGGLVKK